MDTNAPLRRSTRCRRPTYGVGDVVEITHGSTAGGISIGRLISKMAGGESGFDREDNSSDEGGTSWIVSFKESSRIAKDEIVAEKAFTRVVKQASPDDDSWRKLLDDSSEEQDDVVAVAAAKTSGSDVKGNESPELPIGAMRRSRRQSSKLANSMKETSSRRLKSEVTSFVSPTASDDKNTEGKTKKATSASKTTRYGTRFARGNSPRNLKRKAEHQMLVHQKKKKQQQEVKTKGRRGKKRADSSDDKEDQSVVELKMNTGTLYLYRGINARAVFVRKY